jgi:hypothetical protein
MGVAISGTFLFLFFQVSDDAPADRISRLRPA